MKTLSVLGGLLLLGAVWAISQQNSDPRVVPADREDLLRRLNASGAALYSLAVERYKANEAKGETWILRLHHWSDKSTMMKYTDGKHVVASIPVLRSEKEGAQLYVDHCNNLTVRKADILALQGKNDQALKIYQLVKRFTNLEFGEYSQISKRIECAEALVAGGNPEPWLKTLKELTIDHGPSGFEMLGTSPAIATNLLEVSFP